MLVAALAGACEVNSTPMSAAGSGGMDATVEVDSGVPDSGRDSGRDAATVSLEAGGAGSAAAGGGAGAAAESGQGGGTPYANGGTGSTAPSGGAGSAAVGGTPAEPMAGQPAPMEHVIWTQSWTVAIHEASAWRGYPDATMGLTIAAGDFCRFGFAGAASGTAQEYQTDGTCITDAVKAQIASGSAVIFDAAGMNSHGGGGTMPLSGWIEAVTGHTVTKIRRSQTYSIQLLGAGDTSYNYADFEGKWEAIGR